MCIRNSFPTSCCLLKKYPVPSSSHGVPQLPGQVEYLTFKLSVQGFQSLFTHVGSLKLPNYKSSYVYKPQYEKPSTIVKFHSLDSL